MIHPRSVIRCWPLLLLVANIAAAAAPGRPAHALRPPGDYPKLLAYSSPIGDLPAAVQDTLSRYDVVVTMERPERLVALRFSNPNQKYLWQVEPQLADTSAGDNPWWIADTLWSIKRLMTYYVYKNNWYLKDTHGTPINDGHHFVVNWTQYCPVGTFGSAKGLRASQWMASVALPTIALSNRYWTTWSWNSRTSYNGYMFEILADCMSSYDLPIYLEADPNQDGIAEGITHMCSMGGSDEPLSVLFRQENEEFYQRLSAAFPPEFVFTINENTKYIGPWWRTKLSGQKIENWMRGCCPAWATWWDYFYGIRPPDHPSDNWGTGYLWAEWAFDKPVPDSLRGWDLSYIVTWKEANKPADENLRQMRFGLGTTLLGDGYFAYSVDDHWPQWPPEFDWDLGRPVGDFFRELHGADTLYVRTFTKAGVEVNPNVTEVNGVPTQDSRFTFWLPVQDLTVATRSDSSITASWTAPHGEHNDSDSFELRYATFPLTLAAWDSATPYRGNPVTGPPGAPISVTVGGLSPATTYYFAIRSTTGGRAEPDLSNLAQGVTRDPGDPIPPAPITGLAAVPSQTWLDLSWTATGDDSTSGTAALYLLRFLPGDTIDSEAKWARAIPADSLPVPGPSGTTEHYRLRGLHPSTTYAVAVRAQDHGSNLSALHPPFFARTLDPIDQTPPAPIADLQATPGGPGEILLSWSAVGDDGWTGRAARYEVRILPGQRIRNDSLWAAATTPPEAPPVPGIPRSPEAMTLAHLTVGGTYGVAIRAVDDANNLALLSNPLLAQAGTYPPRPPGAITDLGIAAGGPDTAVVAWTAPGRAGNTGQAVRYHVRIRVGQPIATLDDWNQAAIPDTAGLGRPRPAGSAERWTLTGLVPQTVYAIAIRAENDSSLLGGLSNPVQWTTIAAPDVPPPPPPSGLTAARTDPPGSVRITWTAPSAGNLAGFHAYGRRTGGAWSCLTATMIPAAETSVTLQSACDLFALTSLDHWSHESGLSEAAGLAPATLILEGPFPHPVTASCRFLIRIPGNLAGGRVALRIDDAGGRVIRRVYDGPAGGADPLEVRWDRRDGEGRVAAPGFYLATLEVGGHAVHKRIFLSP